jgi:hypothetical protein
MKKSKPMRSFHLRSRGFALVVTLTLMILLTMIAVGLLSLSAISMRGASKAEAQAEARANARLALMLAIGHLQKHSGPDTRITAPSSIVDPNSPPLTGVWRSWEGTNHETRGQFSGRPITPDYSSKKKSTGGGRFLTWLVSGAETGALPEKPSDFAYPAPTDKSIPLLSDGTLAESDPREVHVVPAKVKNTGSFAWWANGENQKARLPNPYEPQDDTSAAQWSVVARSHAVADPKPFELDALLQDSAPAAKAITLCTADLIAKKDAITKPGQSFLDLSTSSVGLLTNTANGGWRKDLSLISESWSNQPTTGLPLFQITPTTASSGAIATTGSPLATSSMIYPWARRSISTVR